MRLHPVPLAVAGLAILGFLVYVLQVMDAPSGVAASRQADRLLADGKPHAALAEYQAALQADPNLLPARLGRALALEALGDVVEAERALDALVLALRSATAEDGRRPFLAAALANRGILHDRRGRHAEALVDYQAALRADADAVAGPGLVDRVLYGLSGASSIAERAAYLEKQLALPPEQRVLSMPPTDQQQRPTIR